MSKSFYIGPVLRRGVGSKRVGQGLGDRQEEARAFTSQLNRQCAGRRGEVGELRERFGSIAYGDR